MHGRVVPILVREQGVGRGLQPLTMPANALYNFAGGSWATTYSPIPHYITDTLESLVLDNTEIAFFDLFPKSISS
jgi:sulfoquinovosidase